MKLSNLNFQRNGVSGTPFFSIVANGLRDEPSGKFIITFEHEDGNEKEIDYSSCRVVQIDDPKACWRGDNIAHDLQKELNRLCEIHSVETIYDLKPFI